MLTRGCGVVDRPKIDDFTTTDDGCVDVPLHWPDDDSPNRVFWPVAHLAGKSLYFEATAHDLVVKILASMDGGATFPITDEEFTVTTATGVLKPINIHYSALKIQVKPAAAGANGTLIVQAEGSSALAV